MPKHGKTIKERMFHEVMHNEPAAVKKERAKKGEKMAHKMEVAIALSKTRRAGGKY